MKFQKLSRGGIFYREKEKNKQREDNWYKVQNLAMGNPQVCLKNCEIVFYYRNKGDFFPTVLKKDLLK